MYLASGLANCQNVLRKMEEQKIIKQMKDKLDLLRENLSPFSYSYLSAWIERGCDISKAEMASGKAISEILLSKIPVGASDFHLEDLSPEHFMFAQEVAQILHIQPPDDSVNQL